MVASRNDHLHLAPGDIVNGSYEVIEQVGCGNFAKVYRCYVLKPVGMANGDGMTSASSFSRSLSETNKTGMTLPNYRNDVRLQSECPVIAMKVLRKGDKLSAMFERRMLRILGERDKTGKARVSRMYEYFEWKNCPVFIMPLHGMSLRSLWLGVNRVSLNRLMVLEFAYDVLETLSFVHFDCRMVHTDLKPENILLEDVQLPTSSAKHRWVICDFGSSSLWRRDRLDSDLISTRPYRAPEVILGNKWDYAVDMWSLGCIIYEVTVGHRLFEVTDDNTHLQMMEKRLGKLPELFRRRSRNSNRYFTSKGTFAHLSERLLSAKHSLSSIRTLFQKDPTFLELLTSLLTYDPVKRITAPYALHLPVFDSIRHRRQGGSITVAAKAAKGVRPAADSPACAPVVSNTDVYPAALVSAAPSLRATEGRSPAQLTASAGSTPCQTGLQWMNSLTASSSAVKSSWKSDAQMPRCRFSLPPAAFPAGDHLSISKTTPSFSKSPEASVLESWALPRATSLSPTAGPPQEEDSSLTNEQRSTTREKRTSLGTCCMCYGSTTAKLRRTSREAELGLLKTPQRAASVGLETKPTTPAPSNVATVKPRPGLAPAVVRTKSSREPFSGLPTSGLTIRPAPVVATPNPPAGPAPVVATPKPPAGPAPVVATPKPPAGPAPVVATAKPILGDVAFLGASAPSLLQLTSSSTSNANSTSTSHSLPITASSRSPGSSRAGAGRRASTGAALPSSPARPVPGMGWTPGSGPDTGPSPIAVPPLSELFSGAEKVATSTSTPARPARRPNMISTPTTTSSRLTDEGVTVGLCRMPPARFRQKVMAQIWPGRTGTGTGGETGFRGRVQSWTGRACSPVTDPETSGVGAPGGGTAEAGQRTTSSAFARQESRAPNTLVLPRRTRSRGCAAHYGAALSVPGKARG